MASEDQTNRSGRDAGGDAKQKGSDEGGGPNVQYDDSGQAHTNAQTRTGGAADRDSHDLTSGIEPKKEREG